MTIFYAKNSYYPLILIAVIGILFLFLLIMWLVLRSLEKKNHEAIQNQSNSVRVFVIDYKKRAVRYFNRADLKKQRVISFQAFLEQFVHEERSKIQKWIEDLANDKEETPLFMECDVIINKDKKSFFSFLQVQKRDTKTKIIHIESYLMKYLVPKTHLLRRSRQVNLNNAQLQDLYNSMKHKNKGACFAIKLFHNHLQGEINKKVDNLLLTQLMNSLISLLNNSRYMIQNDDSSLAIYDFKIDSRREIMQLAHSLSRLLHKYIDINAFRDNYDFSIGICDLKNGDGTLKDILYKAKAAMLAAHSKKDSIALYDAELGYETSNEQSFDVEIKNIIKDKELSYLFRPIVNTRRNSIYGYYCMVQSNNKLYTTIQEIKEYAYRLNQSKDLFNVITRNILPKFINEKDGASLRLFYKVTVSELEFVIKCFSRIAGVKDAKIVIVLDEEEIYHWHLATQQLEDYVDSFKKKGYEIALCVRDKNLILPQEMLEQFDAFLFDEHFTHGLKRDNRLRLAIHSLYERLEPFHRPIIAVDMNSWNGIELMIKTGISFVSSDMISPWSDMLLPVDKKKMLKLKAIAGINKN